VSPESRHRHLNPRLDRSTLVPPRSELSSSGSRPLTIVCPPARPREGRPLIYVRQRNTVARAAFASSMATLHRTYLLINRLWKSDRRRSCLSVSAISEEACKGPLTLMNSFFLPLSSVPLAWFLKTTSSSHRRLILKSGLLRSGFPRAISRSLASASAASRFRS